MSGQCHLSCLALGQQLLEAAEAQQWDRIGEMQRLWQQEAQQCINTLVAQSAKNPDALIQLEVLLKDMEVKIQRLEGLIQQLEQAQQKDLNRLKQAASYLKS